MPVDLNETFRKMKIKPLLIIVITMVDDLQPSKIKEASKYTYEDSEWHVTREN